MVMTLVVPVPYATAVVLPAVDPDTGTVAPRLPVDPLELEPLLPELLDLELGLLPEVPDFPDLPDDPLFPLPPLAPPPLRGYRRWLRSDNTGTYILWGEG